MRVERAAAVWVPFMGGTGMGKRRGEQFWRKYIEAWEHGDLTQAGYCAAHGLSAKSLYLWRHKQSSTMGTLCRVRRSNSFPSSSIAAW